MGVVQSCNRLEPGHSNAPVGAHQRQALAAADFVRLARNSTARVHLVAAK